MNAEKHVIWRERLQRAWSWYLGHRLVTLGAVNAVAIFAVICMIGALITDGPASAEAELRTPDRPVESRSEVVPSRQVATPTVERKKRPKHVGRPVQRSGRAQRRSSH